MKILLTVALVATSPAGAAGVTEQCSTVRDFAEHVMQARQEGKSLGIYFKSAQTQPILQAAVLAASNTPREASREAAQRAVTDFHEDWHAKCLTQPPNWR